MAKLAHCSHPLNILLVTTAYAILSICLYVRMFLLHLHFIYDFQGKYYLFCFLVFLIYAVMSLCHFCISQVQIRVHM